jgi:hypothetical protein
MAKARTPAVTSVPSVQRTGRAGDWLAVGVLSLLTALVAWNRLAFDP